MPITPMEMPTHVMWLPKELPHETMNSTLKFPPPKAVKEAPSSLLPASDVSKFFKSRRHHFGCLAPSQRRVHPGGFQGRRRDSFLWKLTHGHPHQSFWHLAPLVWAAKPISFHIPRSRNVLGDEFAQVELLRLQRQFSTDPIQHRRWCRGLGNCRQSHHAVGPNQQGMSLDSGASIS